MYMQWNVTINSHFSPSIFVSLLFVFVFTNLQSPTKLAVHMCVGVGSTTGAQEAYPAPIPSHLCLRFRWPGPVLVATAAAGYDPHSHAAQKPTLHCAPPMPWHPIHLGHGGVNTAVPLRVSTCSLLLGALVSHASLHCLLPTWSWGWEARGGSLARKYFYTVSICFAQKLVREVS